MITTNYSGNAISNDFIAAVGQPMVAYMCKLYDNGTALTCDIMRLSLTLGGCADPAGDADFAIGEVYASAMEATLYNVSGSLVGHELDVCIGVDIGSGVFEYVQVATVVVTSAKTRAGVTTVQAAGKLAYEATNVPLGVGGELAPSAVASAIATATGLTVAIGTFTSTSTTVTVESSMTCRDALGAMAKRLGGFACETNVGGVLVAPFDGTATYTLDPGCMTALPDVEEADYEVDGVTVQAVEDAYAYGTGRVVIADSAATPTTAAVTWANVDGYAFRAGSANTAILDPRITPFDVLAVTVDGSTVNLPSRGISATYDGGYFGTFSAVGLTDAAEEALMKGPLAAQVAAAQQAAEEAQAVAEATSQHFFADTNGAHITDVTQDEWTAAVADNFSDYDPDTKPYHNQLLNSLGILLRTALNNLVSITRSAIAFYDGQGNAAANIVARFGSDGAQIGLSTTSNVRIDSLGFEFTGDDGGLLLDIGEADETMELAETLEYAEVRATIAQGESGYVDLVLPAVTLPTGATLISYYVNFEFYRHQGSSQSTVRFPCDPYGDATGTIAGGITFAWSYASRTLRLTATETATQYGPVSVSSYSYNILAEHNGAFVQIGTQEAASTTGAATLTVGEGVLASGNFSQAVGQGSGAMGTGSFATGHNTRAWGDYSHAEGVGYYGSSQYGALGTGSHSEGHNTRALGDYSHAQNLNAVASGKGSHAQNDQTIAASANQTAIGKCNVEDTNGDYALIIGNGTYDNTRSNAAVITWLGEYIAQGWAGITQMFAGAVTQTVDSDGVATATGAPRGWLLCDGSAVSRTTYATLFAAIGTTWGAGDGSTTFNLPDLRGRAPIGAGTGSGLTARTLGGKLGSEAVQAHTHDKGTLSITSSGGHDHAIHTKWNTAKPGTSSGTIVNLNSSGSSSSSDSGSVYIASSTGAHTHPNGNFSGSTGSYGSGASGNMQPSAVVNFIIHTGKTS